MLNELGNDTSLDFTTNDRNQTLEAVEGDSSMSVYRVLICLTNSSKTQAEFTQILLDFNFQTQIDNDNVTAGGKNGKGLFSILADQTVQVVKRLFLEREVWGSNSKPIKSPTRFQQLATAVNLKLGPGSGDRLSLIVTLERMLSEKNNNLIF